MRTGDWEGLAWNLCSGELRLFFFFGMVTYVKIKQLINDTRWREFPSNRRLRRRGKSVAVPGVKSRLPGRLNQLHSKCLRITLLSGR